MSLAKVSLPVIAIVLVGGAAHAASRIEDTQQRNVNQEKRIEEGLKSGALSTEEAARLEGDQRRVAAMEARDLRNGAIAPAEKARIEAAENQVSQDIDRAEHNAIKGNPNSATSRHMQADVQRDIYQQERIQQGIAKGTLTNGEVRTLERGQARVDRKEAAAGANGRLSAAEQARIQNTENNQSKRIYSQKHDEQDRDQMQ